MTGQIVFILWRESIEALLVIGILASWLANRQAGPRARAYLWGGVAAGLALALAFAALVLGFSELLSGTAREALMTGMVFLASALIVQMVVWMRRHGRTLKRELETGLDSAARADHWGAVFVLAMLAVAREGSETVVFLYGTLAAAKAATLPGVLAAVVTGLSAAALTYAVLRFGSRFLPWRWFFRVSEVVLLLLGAALFVTGVGDLVAAGVLPYGASLWDTGTLLDDSGPLGGLVAGLTGYRSAPDPATLGAWITYWSLVTLALRAQGRRARATERAA
jgi:high-affinity iron transporter